MKAKIYLSYFNDSQRIENEVLTPIQVGADISSVDLNMLKDNSGDNISDLNPFYCEMTGVYWAWKNDEASDYVGAFHYRRLFDFNIDRIRSRDPHGMILYHSPDSNMYDEFKLDEASIKSLLLDYDALLPEEYDVEVIGFDSLYEHYCNAPHHFKKDIDLSIEVVHELYPNDLIGYKNHLQQSKMFATNMFVLRRDIFESMCSWLFPILDTVYEKIDMTGYSVQEKRVIGYLSERLMSYYLTKYIVGNSDLAHIQMGRLFLNATAKLPEEPSIPNTNLPIMTLALASDQNYVGHLGSLLASIEDNHDNSVFLDIIVLDGGLNTVEHKQLNNIVKHRDNIKLSFIKMAGMFKEISMHSHFTEPTLYRLYLPEILTQRNKILYLDTDMTVVDSLQPLYETDIEGYYAAAVRDLIMRTFIHKKVRSHQPSGGLESQDYLNNFVQMTGDTSAYLQAGTILFNLDEMRRSKLSGKMIDDLINKQYWFLDQDILNKYLQPKVKIVDNRWNVVSIPHDHLEALQGLELEEYHNSHSNPAVIHYAGLEKPWISGANPHGHYYWNYLRKTAWYETMLFWYIGANLATDKPQESIVKHVHELPKTSEIFDVYKRRIKKGVRDKKVDLLKKLL